MGTSSWNIPSIDWMPPGSGSGGGAIPGLPSGMSGQNQWFSALPSVMSPALGPSASPSGPSGPTPAFANQFTGGTGGLNPNSVSPGGGGGGTPGVVPGNGLPGGGVPNTGSSGPNQFTGPQHASGLTGIGKGLFAQNPIDPALTSQFFNWLQSQIGQGVPAFNLSTLLPSSGQATAPGQLNAPLTQLLQQLQQAFAPGTGGLGDLASKGFDTTNLFHSMVQAQQRNIGENAANLKEQFNLGGDLASSPFGTAMSDYFSQTTKDQNALEGQLQLQGVQDQLQAAGLEGGLGQFLQGLDQQSIQNVLNEFIRTSPQYNPLLQYQFGASTTFPPIVNPQHGAGALGGLLGGAGSLLSSIPGLAKLFGGGA